MEPFPPPTEEDEEDWLRPQPGGGAAPPAPCERGARGGRRGGEQWRRRSRGAEPASTAVIWPRFSDSVLPRAGAPRPGQTAGAREGGVALPGWKRGSCGARKKKKIKKKCELFVGEEGRASPRQPSACLVFSISSAVLSVTALLLRLGQETSEGVRNSTPKTER